MVMVSEDGSLPVFQVSISVVLKIIIMIVVALKGHNLRFLQSLHYAANCLQHVRSSGQGATVCKSHATHQALIMCSMSCATWYPGTAQLLSLAMLKSHLF